MQKVYEKIIRSLFKIARDSNASSEARIQAIDRLRYYIGL